MVHRRAADCRPGDRDVARASPCWNETISPRIRRASGGGHEPVEQARGGPIPRASGGSASRRIAASCAQRAHAEQNDISDESVARPGGDRRHRPDPVLQGPRALRVRHGGRGDPRRVRRRGHRAARDRRRGPLRHGDHRRGAAALGRRSRAALPGEHELGRRRLGLGARARGDGDRDGHGEPRAGVPLARARQAVGVRQGRGAGRPLLGAHRRAPARPHASGTCRTAWSPRSRKWR